MKKTLSVLLLCGSLLMTGCGDSRENFVFTGNNPVVVAPPVCQDDAYQTNQGQQLVVNAASGVLANDSPNGGTVTFSATSTGGGTVTGSNDGSFIYTPAANFNGTDTFTYTVTNSAGSATCTVTITVNAVVTDGFFVDSLNGSDTTGSFLGGNPFQTIQAALAAASTESEIGVRPGNYSGTVTLKDGQILRGIAAVSPRAVGVETAAFRTLSAPIVHDAIAPDQTYFVSSANGNDATGQVGPGQPFATIQAAIEAAPESADIVVESGVYEGEVTLKARQRLLGSGSTAVREQGTVRPILDGRIILGDGNTVDFIRVVNAPDDAIDGDGRNGGTITNCEIDTTTSSLVTGIAANSGTGDWVIANNAIDSVEGIGIALITSGSGQMTARVNNNAITNSSLGAIGLAAEMSSQLTAQVHNNVMTGNQDNVTFEVIVGDMATFCLDLENNTNDDVYRFDRATTTSTVKVEEFSVPTIPSNTGTVVVDPISEPITPVADGACGF